MKAFERHEPKKEQSKKQHQNAGDESNPIDLESDKENGEMEKLASRVQQLSQDEAPKPAKAIPATPSAARLALPELFGMADLDSPAHKLARTPEDGGVSWNYDASAFSSSGVSYGESRGKKRRAKSSSPGSSPAQKSPHFEASPLDIDERPTIGQGLGLFAGSAQTRLGANNPLLSFLANTNSPQPDPRRSTLQRSVSYGDQVTKRRKIGAERSFGGFTDISREAAQKHPKIGPLIEGILERKAAVAKPESNGPSSSSPARMQPIQDDSDVMMTSSPLKQAPMGPPPPRSSVSRSRSPSKSPVKVNAVPRSTIPPSSPESDYGMSDYDDEILNMAAEQVLSTQRAAAHQASSPTARKTPAPPIPQAYTKPPEPIRPAPKPFVKLAAVPAKQTGKAAAPIVIEEEDEFAGIFSDDDFEGAEIVPIPATLSKTNSFTTGGSSSVAPSKLPPATKQTSYTAAKRPAPKAAPIAIKDDGDETDYDAYFDNSDDDEDIAGAVAAMPSAATSSYSVRKK